MQRIPLTDLKNGYLYKIRGRNANYGIYNETVYTILRNKFGHDSLDFEFDRSNRGTAIPIEEIEKVPDDVDKLKYLLEWETKQTK